MLRGISAMIVMGMASIASAQVFFLPPPQVDVYNPYYPYLNAQAVARLRALSPPYTYVPGGGVNGAAPYGYFTGTTDVYGNPLIAVYPPVEQGIDPLTGQALYFRKADILPPPMAAPPEEPSPAPRAQPQTAPTTRPAMGPARPGTVIITPHKARTGDTRVASR